MYVNYIYNNYAHIWTMYTLHVHAHTTHIQQQLPDCNNEGKVLGAFLYEEQRRAVKQLADNLEKVSLSSARYSPKHVGKKKPAFDGGAGGATQVSKNDLQFNEEKVKV